MDRRAYKEFFSTKSLLFVDDDSSICDAIEVLLSRYFKQIHITTDPLEAIEIFKSHEIDLVMSDVTMPDISGFELAQRLKDINQDIKILFVSGHNESDYVSKMQELGAGYLVKPINHKNLFETIYTTIS
jgi:two-component system response regulator YesN